MSYAARGSDRRQQIVSIRTLAILLTVCSAGAGASAQTLIDNVYTHGYTGWVDAFPERGGNWRLSFDNPTLIDTNNANPAPAGAVANTGVHEPDVLIQNEFTAPATYDLSATMRTNDDDLLGLVWNYQDPDNYFRVGIRQQAGGSFGATEGLAVQKIVNGVVTQLSPSTPIAGPAAIDQSMIDNRTPFDLRVAVDGSNYEVFFNDVSLASGSDADLAAGRKIGVQSWAQQADASAVTPFWGTEVEEISVTEGANVLYSETFAARPVAWRKVVMTNAAGVSTLTTASREDIGNFGLDINDPWILQHSNGFENATFGNVDFIGPAIVVDEPGSNAFSNYQMRTRLATTDNDGIGVLLRVQDDDNFYRITFANQATDAEGVTRAPSGMSVQKVRNGVWTELYRDDNAPLFVYTPGAGGTTPSDAGFPAFDLSVGAVGNQLKIQVRDELGNVINYPLIVDGSDPILAGTVGLQTWGNANSYFTHFGGVEGPLLTQLSAFTAFDVTINRGTGNLTLTNNGATPVDIQGITIGSSQGGLDPVEWRPVATFYDEPPGDGSVDADDPWTILSETANSLSEREESPDGDGGTIGVGQSINLGDVWIQSRIEDVTVDVELTDNSVSTASVSFSGGPGGMPFSRSDLNTDGTVNASDWPLFFPNMLADLSSLSGVQQALAGDLDGDGDNDVNDFSLFKFDFDAVNGQGAFQAMLEGVPEPGAGLLLAVGAMGFFVSRRSVRRVTGAVAASTLIVALLADGASAALEDFTTYTVEQFPPASGFAEAIWTITPTTATHPSNSTISAVYSPDSALGKRYIGRVTPGTDDDVIGFVLGFSPGDSQIGSGADYLLVDWKGVTQTFDFNDADIFNPFHSDTAGGEMPVGLALSRVTGSATADELWQHADLPGNPTGSVAELARGATLGSAPYNRSGGSHLFDITYTATNITVSVDGVEQFNVDGAYPDGRFGLYTGFQGPAAVFTEFEAFSATGFAGLSATVDRSDGNITLTNAGTDPLEFDYYQLDSPAGSLDVGDWNSLSDQDFQAVGPSDGESWDEAGGSNNFALAEVYLQSQTSLAGGGSVSIGQAYNHFQNAEDLTLTFRTPSGLLIPGDVEYIGEPPSLLGDYDLDGRVAGDDIRVWQLQFGGPGSADGDNSGTVDGPDLAIVEQNFGAPFSATATGAASGSGVPEPTSIVLVSLATLVGATTRRRRPEA